MDSQVAFLPQGFGTAQASAAVFWLLLGLPGFAVLKRWLPAALESGGLGAVALSYLASFVVLSPLSILGYALHLPIWVFSAAVAIALAVSVEWCVRERKQLGLSRPSWLALACTALIATDMVLGLRAGSHFGGDARYHIARVRMLLDLGFNSWDPLVPGHRFDDIYHTNLYHALLAASAQLTAIEAPAAWAFCWFWVKLVCAGGMYQLAWAVLGQRWLAWISAALFALWMAADSIMPYPNMIATYWLVPLALSFLVEACTGPPRAWPAIGLGAIALVMPQVHLLYYVFACLLIGPVLAFFVVRERLRKRPQRMLTWALLALAIGTPFMGVTLWQRTHHSVPPPITRAHPAPADPDHLPWAPDRDARRIASRDRSFLQLPSGMMMLDPASYLRPSGQQIQLLVLLAAGVILGRRRKQMAILAGVLAIVLASLYVPPLCSALIKVAGAPFVVRRLIGVPSALHLALLPCALAVMLPEVLSRERLHGVWLGVALVHAYLHGIDSQEWTRAEYVADAISQRPLQGGLHGAAMRRALCRNNLPPEAVVATALVDTGLSAACNAYPLALPLREPTHAVKDMTQRRVDALALSDPSEDADKRIAILRYYGVSHIWVHGEKNFAAMHKAYQPWLVKLDQYRADRIMTLDLQRKAVTPRPIP